MPVCVHCGKAFTCSKFLITHLKIFHRCQENSTFICAEKDCHRSFPNIKTFRKHLKSHNSECNEIPFTLDKSIAVPNLLNETNSTLNREPSTSSCSTNCESTHPDTLVSQDFNEFKQQIINNNVLFINSLYNENTFCRKDVDKIMSAVKNLLNNPINKFKEYILNDLYVFYSGQAPD